MCTIVCASAHLSVRLHTEIRKQPQVLPLLPVAGSLTGLEVIKLG